MIDILVCDDSAEIVEQVKKLLCSWERKKLGRLQHRLPPIGKVYT